MASGFKFDATSMLKGLAEFGSRSDYALKMYAETAALSLQNYMKQNRPWTDRTGQARQRLTAHVETVPKGYQIVLSHGVDYGVWLELAHEKRFAIIHPTILAKGSEVIDGFKTLLKGMK